MKIIGQKELLQGIDDLIRKNHFPRFSIIVGEPGSGKKLISDYISKNLGCQFIPCEIKVEEVRNVLDLSYTIDTPTVYMFADADKMSSAAKNSILKVTEEPPQNAYFIMTLLDTQNTLGTLLSRGTVFYMNKYTPNQLEEYCSYKGYNVRDNELNIIKKVCLTPQDVQNAVSGKIQEFYSLAEKFINLIGTANLSNELKVGIFLSYKEDDKKYDPVLFMRTFMFLCNDQFYTSNDKRFFEALKCTSSFLSLLSTKGINKVCVIDNWIISLHFIMTGGEL